MVEDYISPLGYEVFDYTKGIAIKINGDPKKNNQIRIGKLLKDKNILEKFNLDEDRTNSKKYNTEDYRIVISQSYDDIINMSTGRSWTSCMSFPDGRYSYMIKADILEGTLIAYLINKDDMEITKPLGRVLIKPFSTEDGETQYLTETKVYGNVPMSQSFIRSVKSWLNNRQTPSFEGWVSLKKELYNDSFGGSDSGYLYKKGQKLSELDPRGYDYEGYDEDGNDREGYDHQGKDKNGIRKDGLYQCCDGTVIDIETFDLKRLTKDEFLFLDRLGIALRRIKKKRNGEIDIVGDLTLSDDVEYPNNTIPIQFGLVSGNVTIRRSVKINDLTNFPHTTLKNVHIYTDVSSLKRHNNKRFTVNGNFLVSSNRLTTLLGGPTIVRGDYRVDNPTYGDGDLESVEGVATFIGGGLYIVYQKIKDIKPLKYTKVKGRRIVLNNNRLESLVGLPHNLFTLNVSHNRLKDLVGLPKEVDTIDVSNNPLESLNGLNIFENLDLGSTTLDNLNSFPKHLLKIDNLVLPKKMCAGGIDLTALGHLKNIRTLYIAGVNNPLFFNGLNKDLKIRNLNMDINSIKNIRMVYPKVECVDFDGYYTSPIFNEHYTKEEKTLFLKNVQKIDYTDNPYYKPEQDFKSILMNKINKIINLIKEKYENK